MNLFIQNTNYQNSKFNYNLIYVYTYNCIKHILTFYDNFIRFKCTCFVSRQHEIAIVSDIPKVPS